MKRLQLPKMGQSWVVSLITGFALIFILLLGINVKAIDMMKNDKMQELEQITRTVRRSVDHSLIRIQESTVELILNNENTTLRQAENEELFTQMQAYRYSEVMKNIKTANVLIEDVFVYYPQWNYIVGAGGSYKAEGYFLLKKQLEKSEYEQWSDEILNTENIGFFFYTDQTGNRELYFRQQVPMNQNENPTAVIIVKVNGDEIENLLNMMLPYDDSTSIFVCSKENEIYRSSENIESINLKENEENIENGEIRRFEDKKYIGWLVPSDYNTFYYSIVSDKTALLQNILVIQKMLILGIIMCTITGMGISVWLGKKHYKKIENVINRLNENVIAAKKDSVLTEILERRVIEPDMIKSMLLTCGVNLDYVNYQIVLMNLSEVPRKYKVKGWIEDISMQFEKEYRSMDVIPALRGDYAVMLFNYDEFENNPGVLMVQKMERSLETPVEYIESERFMLVEHIVPIFEQLFFKFQEKLGIKGKTEISIEKEGQLLEERWRRALSMRVYDEAIELLQELIEKYIWGSNDSYITLNRQYTVINDVLECVGREDERYKTNYYAVYVNRIRHCVDIREISIQIKEILKELEQHNSNYSIEQKDKLPYKIKKIIDDNYDQNYLGLCYISEQVNVSTSYVSKVFKDEYGVGIVEYMNGLRIQQAKKLMDRENMTVKEIAEKVGFASDIHFIRSFKKYENITPGMYKKQKKQ